MLKRSGATEVVIDPSGAAKLAELIESYDALFDGEPARITFLLPDDLGELEIDITTDHTILTSAALEEHSDAASNYTPKPVTPDDLSYLLFTSGSTGNPKGVMVAQRNVVAFVDAMVERYGFSEKDRFSQTFDLTFDLSAFDMFCAWDVGACLCVPTASEKLFPGKYVKKQALTVWFSVPSTGVIMSKLRMLKPDSYPTIRYALFCGEALTLDIAQKFAGACPNAEVENLYGPTELTIACTLYRLSDESEHESIHGVVPIGEPYPNMLVLIASDEKGTAAIEKDGALEGELLLAGPQVTLGYLGDKERTDKAFIVPPGECETFYRTGDRVRMKIEGGNQAGPILYLGRVDHQIKIKGYRVELGEVEALGRDVGGMELAIAIGYPPTPSGADGIVLFISDTSDKSNDEILAELKDKLPPYMQPSRVIEVKSFPLNANGKVDRGALLKTLTETSE